jgi:hypothetical protein
MRPIKFDLPLNGTRIATLEQLGENLTPEILEPFRSGKLAKWLRARSLDEQAGAVEALLAGDVQDEAQLFKKLCAIFEREVDEDDAREMIEDYKTLLASKNAAVEEITKTQQIELPKEDNEEEQNTQSVEQEPPPNIMGIFGELFPILSQEKPKEKDKKEYVINQSILNRIAREKNFFITVGIPNKKLHNALKSYGYNVSKEEELLVLCDDTLLGSAKNGFLITNRSFYCSEFLGEKKSIRLHDIYSVFAQGKINDSADQKLFINDKEFFQLISNSSKSSFLSLEIVVDFLKDYLAL